MLVGGFFPSVNHIETKMETLFPEVHYAVPFGGACAVSNEFSYYLTDSVGLLPEGRRRA